MTSSNPLLGAIAVIAAPFVFFVVFVALLTVPFIQRNSLYAHRINTLLWSKLDEPERWGFANNQVTPFTLQTPDGESIYAWHILPLPLYLKNEEVLSAPAVGRKQAFEDSESFRLLKEDPEAKLVLYFHGNLGHLAQAVRPDTYHALTDTSSYHVIAIDYRGFGRSTGSPSENGLIADASTVVEWATNVAGVPANRIVIFGHSLGTAVACGVAEMYAMEGIEFAGIVLLAGFGDLASLIGGYRIFGLIPILGPFVFISSLPRFLDRFIVDKWHSSNRVANIVRNTKQRLRLTMIHARNDWDIPWTQDNRLFRAAAAETTGLVDDAEFDAWKEERTIHTAKKGFVTTWRADPNIVVRQELIPHGGHDPINGFAPVILAVMRSFQDGAGGS